MKIRYDDKGQILAVGDDGCDWPEPLLKLAEKDLPADLLGGLGRYVVRKGKLAKAAGTGAAAFELPAVLLEAGRTAPVAALFEPGGLALAVSGLPGRPRAKRTASPAPTKKAPAKKARRGK